jgi:SurA-like N-terminal domain
MRKHSAWLWWVIIAAIIITFVWWGSSPSSRNGPGGPGNLGRIDGEIITPTAFAETRREVELMYFFANGTWPDRAGAKSGFDLERETYYRLVINRRQQEMGVHVSEEALARLASDRLRSMNRGKPWPPEDFARQVLAPQGLDFHDLERFLRHEIGLQQLASVIGLGGELVTPQEVRNLYEREHQELQTQVAFFSATNYLASVTPKPEQIGQFFTNQMSRYHLPERLQVNYVKFPVSNFLVEAVAKINENTNLNEILEAVYQQRGTNYYSDAKSPEEAKQRILKEEQEGLALEFARKKALEFANTLYAREPMRAENLITMAKEAGLTPLVTPPFDRDEPPAGLDVRADFLKAAFALNAEEPFSQTIAGADGVYLISLNKTLPSEIPSLESIRDRVTQDYRFVEAMQLARQAAMKFDVTATNSLAGGKSFSDVCAAAGVTPLSPPPFSLSTRTLAAIQSHVSLPQFKQAAFSLTPGHMSPLQPCNDGAFVVFLQAKLPLNETQWTADQPAFTRSVRQARRSEAFNYWFNQQFAKIRPGIPYFQQPPQLSGQPKP